MIAALARHAAFAVLLTVPAAAQTPKAAEAPKTSTSTLSEAEVAQINRGLGILDQKINLTVKQKTDLRRILESAELQRKELKAKLKTLEDKLKGIDAETREKVGALLTAEQKEKIKTSLPQPPPAQAPAQAPAKP